MPVAESTRTLEKRLSRYRKELRGIGGAVGIEHRWAARFISRLQGLVLPHHHLRPRRIFGPTRQCWCAVGGVVLEVELMGKLVQHHVLAIERIRPAPLRRVPGQDDRSKPIRCVTEEGLLAFLPNGSLQMSLSGHVVRGRIDQDTAQLRIIVSLAMEQEKAGLRRNRQANFIGKFETAAAFEPLLGQEDPDVAQELILIRWREPAGRTVNCA